MSLHEKCKVRSYQTLLKLAHDTLFLYMRPNLKIKNMAHYVTLRTLRILTVRTVFYNEGPHEKIAI